VSTPTDLVSVTVEGKSGSVRVYIPEADALRLANVTGCVVRLERVYTPASTAASRPKAATAQGSAPERIFQRMSASPDRSFRAADFTDLGIELKHIRSVLHRLATESKKIERPGEGLYRVRRVGAVAAKTVEAPSGSARGGETSQANVMAFMRKHPGTPFRAAEVASGMGLSAGFRPSIASSLKRLVAKGDVTHAGAQFTLSEGGGAQ
jgi:hypothetical protein